MSTTIFFSICPLHLSTNKLLIDTRVTKEKIRMKAFKRHFSSRCSNKGSIEMHKDDTKNSSNVNDSTTDEDVEQNKSSLSSTNVSRGKSPEQKDEKTGKLKIGKVNLNKICKQLNVNINFLPAIKFKMLFPVLSVIFYCVCLVHAGFFTFYFPNMFKPRGFDELSDMITSIESRINETKDAFADAKYFWGLMQEFDHLDKDSLYPDESVCSNVFPMFRDLAIEYANIDFQYYLKPIELFRKELLAYRADWYPDDLESKAALPRAWEQNLNKLELEIKIEWMDKLTNEQKFRHMRQKMIEIWKNVRRSLDTSLPCLYLRYAYRQVAEDLNQFSLESNLRLMQHALKIVESGFKRIDKYAESDQKIIDEIEEEITKKKRFTIRS